MSDLTFNKVAGAVLATGLAIVGLRELSAGVFAPQEVEKPGYEVAVVEDAGGGAAEAEAPIDWGTVLPTADVAAGQAAFAKCTSCHNIDAGGPNGTGPNLYGVVGRKPGSHAGFAYSPAMTDLGSKVPAWDYEHLHDFIHGPQKYLNGTKMTFVGLKKREDLINMIAFLHSKGSNLPIPAPNPAAAAPAEGAASAEGAAPGAAAEGQPTATDTAAPPAPGGGPAGQGPGAPAAAQPGPKGATPTGGPNH